MEVKKYIRKLEASSIRLYNVIDRINFKKVTPKADYLFIHINKTGGTSIEKKLGVLSKQLYTATEIKHHVGQMKWQQSFKFAFVRNPWDKVYSQYKYRKKMNYTKLRERPLEFNDWIELTFYWKNSFYYDNPKMFLPQIDWICNEKGKIIIDFIGKFENLSTDFEKVSEVLGLDSNLPHINKGKKGKSYKQAFSDKSKDIIFKFFKKDVDAFNYDF